MTLRSSFPLLRTKVHIFLYITSKCYKKIYPRNTRRHGSSDFIRNLNGYFGVARAQEILEEIFFKNGRGPEIIYHSSRQSQHNL